MRKNMIYYIYQFAVDHTCQNFDRCSHHFAVIIASQMLIAELSVPIPWTLMPMKI
jgi:hypothetical protein